MSEQLCMKAVKELDEYNFIFPDFQRGYRWTATEVSQLLNDLYDFFSNDRYNKLYYCLQPLVVEKTKGDENTYEVIDGQQRLTTVFLIDKYASTAFSKPKTHFSIDYASRKGSKKFIENILDEYQSDSILQVVDFYNLGNAMSTIISWFTERIGKADSDDFKTTLRSNLRERVKFIWYEVNEKDGTPNEIFSRLNAGKIRLSDAELIKAILLSDGTDYQTNKDAFHLKQLALASSWDAIEQQLQDESFWAFITSDEADFEPRIDFLFSIQVPKDEKPFDYFMQGIKDQTTTTNEIWENTYHCYEIIHEWFTDTELFNLIGFLVNFSNKMTVRDLIDCYRNRKDIKTKNDFRIYLKSLIKQMMQSIPLRELSYVVEFDSQKITQVLLLFNIITMQHKNQKFPFHLYKKHKWSLEHIHAQNAETLQKSDWSNWLAMQLPSLDIRSSKESNEEVLKIKTKTKVFIEQINAKKEIPKEEFIDLSNRINKILSDDTPSEAEEEHSIGNLALLDIGANAAFSNSPFVTKRYKLKELDQEERTYIPICTRYAFFKYYNPDDRNVLQWSHNDGVKYFNAIVDVLKDYKPENNTEWEKQL